MIQRIQSLYLLIATAAFICLFFFPFAHYITGEGKIYELTVLGVTENNMISQRAVPLLAGVILLAVLSFTVIFLYKKRVVQSRMTAVCLLLNVGLIAGMFLYSDSVASSLKATAEFGTASYISVVPLVFLVLANRAIRKDELKVRSSERLR